MTGDAGGWLITEGSGSPSGTGTGSSSWIQLPYVIVADLRRHLADSGQFIEDADLGGDLRGDFPGVVRGVLSDVVEDAAQVAPGLLLGIVD